MNKITDIKKIIIVLVLVFLDQISKYFFYGKNIEIIKDIFIIKSSTNTGVIFGIFSGNFFITIFLPLLIIAFLIYEYSEDRHISYLFIIVGLFGNLLDRIIRGFVVDFIYIPVVEKYNIFLFNLADLYLVLGVILGLVYLIKKGHKK